LADVAAEAVDEVGNPTILATFTVIAAVFPMAFVGGLMGPYMRPIPIGASMAMIFSLMVAFVVSPWAALRVLAHAKPNSHLSLLAMADSWRVLGTDMHNDIMCSTPPFLVRRLIVGLAFEEPTFERSINAAMSSGEIKGHDAVFAGSVRDWTSAVASRNIDAYERLFTGTRDFFKDRLERGRKDSEKLISLLEASG
jgi:multidrug efflux pump subunit AcrB